MVRVELVRVVLNELLLMLMQLLLVEHTLLSWLERDRLEEALESLVLVRLCFLDDSFSLSSSVDEYDEEDRVEMDDEYDELHALDEFELQSDISQL